MTEIAEPKKSRFLKAQFAVIVCILCIWIIRSGAFEIDSVKAGILKQVVKADPDNVEAHLFLGDYYADLCHYHDAIRGLKEAIKTNPNDAPTCSELGDLCYYLGYNKEAIESYQQAIQIEPGTGETHGKLAKVYLEIGNKDLALQEYVTLKSLDEESAKELFGLLQE